MLAERPPAAALPVPPAQDPARRADTPPTDRARGWAVTLLVTFVAGLTRFFQLGNRGRRSTGKNVYWTLYGIDQPFYGVDVIEERYEYAVGTGLHVCVSPTHCIGK